MFSSDKHRKDCFPQNTLYIALQGTAHKGLEQISKDTFPSLPVPTAAAVPWLNKEDSTCLLHTVTSVRVWRAEHKQLQSGWIKASQQLQHSLSTYRSQNEGKGKGQSHRPQLRARKIDLEAIKQFRMMGENV